MTRDPGPPRRSISPPARRAPELSTDIQTPACQLPSCVGLGTDEGPTASRAPAPTEVTQTLTRIPATSIGLDCYLLPAGTPENGREKNPHHHALI